MKRRTKYQIAHELLQRIEAAAHEGVVKSDARKQVPFFEVVKLRELVDRLDDLIAVKAEEPG
jgi:hypothetical protein